MQYSLFLLFTSLLHAKFFLGGVETNVEVNIHRNNIKYLSENDPHERSTNCVSGRVAVGTGFI